MDINKLKENPVEFLEETYNLKLLPYQKEILGWLFINKDHHISVNYSLSGVLYRRYIREISDQIYDGLKEKE